MHGPRFLLACLLSGCAAVFSGSAIAEPLPQKIAQIIPDQTLGNESSTVISDVDVRDGLAELIEGGATRGQNLFHSFSDFNVLDAQRVYFASPEGIESILSRVTGNNVSNIFGTLGVDGAADLFFINPNGIVFGVDSNLDVEGSFHATTADAISTGDGIFSASRPEQSQLLSITPDVSFFNYLTESSGDIVSRSQVSVGGDLTLSANTLDVQGGVFSGGNLSLLAANTVRIRDTTEIPFIALSGRDLLVQGNESVDIVALNHPESGLFSYGDTILRSAEPVGGDAHYFSRGDFRVEDLAGNAGSLFSPLDPIIRAYGDVVIEQYAGTSLHIIAGGFVIIGTATISAPDVGTVDIDFLQENVELSDGTFVGIDGGAQATLDIRAGVDQGAISDLPFSSASGQNPLTDFISNINIEDSPSSADIVIGDIWINVPDGLVMLTNNYLPNTALSGGDITVTGNGVFNDGIDVGSSIGKGGSVFIDSRDNIQVVNSKIEATGATSLGTIVLLADDTITLANSIDSGRRAGLLNSIVSSSEDSRDGIRLVSDGLALLNGAQIVSFVGERGNSSNILLSVNGPILLDGVNRVNGRSSAISSSILEGGTGASGLVDINADSMEVLNGAQISTLLRGEGRAGDVTLAIEGDLRLDGANSTQNNVSGVYSGASSDAEGQGGSLTITADNLEVLNGAQITSIMRGRGVSGDVSLFIEDTVRIEGRSLNSGIASIGSGLAQNATGAAGNLLIVSENLSILRGAQIFSSSLGMGNSGNVALRVSDTINLETGDAEGLSSGIFSSIGLGAQGQAGDVVVTTANLSLLNGARLDSSTSGAGSAGNIILDVENTARFQGWDASDGDSTRVASSVNANGTGSSGAIFIRAGVLEVLDGAQIASRTSSAANAGDITLQISELALFDGVNQFDGNNQTDVIPSIVSSSARLGSSGNGGNIRLTAADVSIINGAEISSSSSGQGNAGDITLRVREDIRLDGRDPTGNGPSVISSTIESSSGEGGDLSINANNVFVGNGAFISAESLSPQGRSAGDISLNVRDRLRTRDGSIFTSAIASSGGQIKIDASTVVLRDNSDILSGVGFGENEGGDIVIVADALVALEDSDIVAAAVEGVGGSIDLGQTTLFSDPLNPVSRNLSRQQVIGLFDNGRVDVNATGGVAEGDIFIPRNDFVENSLNELPESLLNSESILSSSCISRDADDDSTLALTGRDRLPQAPSETTSTPYSVGTVQSIPADTEAASVTEPQSIYQLADGRFLMSRDCQE